MTSLSAFLPKSQVTMMEQNFDKFFKANKGLVHKVCQHVYKRVLSMGMAVEYDDLVQEASITMMKAHKGFDASKGFTFSTYYVRAAYNDLNRFLRHYTSDVQVLQIKSMQAAVGDDGEPLDMESIIAGAHDNPEQVYEARQLEWMLERRLSPLAKLLIEMTMDPSEEIQQEWSMVCRKMGRLETSAITFSFVDSIVQTLDPTITFAELSEARREIATMARELF